MLLGRAGSVSKEIIRSFSGGGGNGFWGGGSEGGGFF